MNSEEDVKAASTKAFKALPDISAAISALTVLRAVGPATASGNYIFLLGCVIYIHVYIHVQQKMFNKLNNVN